MSGSEQFHALREAVREAVRLNELGDRVPLDLLVGGFGTLLEAHHRVNRTTAAIDETIHHLERSQRSITTIEEPSHD